MVHDDILEEFEHRLSM
jgi:hypothetical protein